MLFFFSSASANADDGGCERANDWVGECPETEAAVGDGGVEVSAGWEEVTSGTGAEGTGGGSGGGGGRGGNGGNSGGGGEVEVDDTLPDGFTWGPGEAGEDTGAGLPGTMPRQIVPVPGAPACAPQTPCDPALVVRISDLVSIEAKAPTQGMEPDGWLVVGIPTNFFASASAHVTSGPLLGSPAEVRFSPVGFTWDYGDGSAGTTADGGASWAALGLTEFSATSTSHVYENTGTLTIGLSVSYAAAYRFDGGEWRAVEGVLTVPAAPMTAIADRAGTVLVAEACAANPAGVGCQ
ncbi:PKD domain-containing protein [Cryobacterium sp. AP23]